jgi:hypothetical protein
MVFPRETEAFFVFRLHSVLLYSLYVSFSGQHQNVAFERSKQAKVSTHISLKLAGFYF